MIDMIQRVLRKFGFHEPATRDEEINAETEDKGREVASIVDALQVAFSKRREHNAKLRESIRIANHRTNSFADFERMVIRKEASRD